MIKKYFRNTIWLFLEKAVRVCVTLTVWALVIRYLGPEQFGIFSYALSYVFLFGILAELGMEAVLVKDLVERPDDRRVIMGSAFWLRAMGAGLAYILIMASFYFLVKDPVARVLIAVMALRLFFIPFASVDSFFQARVLSKYAVFAQLMGLATTAVLCAAFVFSQKPLFYFAWTVVLEAAVASAGFILFYRWQHVDRWVASGEVMRQLLRRSWPLIVAGLAISIYMRLDQIMIAYMLGNAAVGQYAVAVRISEAFYFIPLVITSSLFPAIIQAKKKGERIYYGRLRALNACLVWAALGLVMVFTFAGKGLIGLFFGPAYFPAVQVLLLHMWAAVFVFLGVARGKWAVNEGVSNLTMVYIVLGALINVVLNVWWIPIWGIQGAAMATVVSQCFAATLSNLLHAKTRPIFFMQMQALNPAYLMRHRWQG